MQDVNPFLNRMPQRYAYKSGWDTQLIARRAGSKAPLEVNTQVGDSQKEYILLWRNSEKPKEPFNLTPYAITLVS